MTQNQARQVRNKIVASLQPAPETGCRRDTPRCANARNYRYEINPCCREHLRFIVQETIPVLETHGVVFWADYGTLLGAVRNPLTTWKDYPWLPQEQRPASPLTPGVIPHDKDADFGILAVEFIKLCQVRRDLERKGLSVFVRPGARSMKVRLSAINHTNVDFFNWFDKGGLLHRKQYIPVDMYKGRHFQKDQVFPLETVEWEGMTLPAPKNPAAFCAFRYGSSWMTPVPANHDGVRR